jgi:alanine dehydrogenase
MSKLQVGVIATSHKENELRLPIHPDHLRMFDDEIKNNIYFERGYGARFGFNDNYLKKYCSGLLAREELFKKCDVILLLKPTVSDLKQFSTGQVLWGWCHCVQGKEITQIGIDKKLTYIALENTNIWSKSGEKELHVFHRNSELAGYCGVYHSLQIMGLAGIYGKKRKAAIICFGDTARGAIYALKGLGFNDITVFTRRPAQNVHHFVPGVRYARFQRLNAKCPEALCEDSRGGMVSMAKVLSEYGIIVNCILQDTDAPLIFIRNSELKHLLRETLIIDISCDSEMGFEFARPTSFDEPTINLGRGIIYYSVDHMPSLLWRAATHEISEALLPYMKTVMRGKKAWERSNTITKAIEICEGNIINSKILHFQNRDHKYPHAFIR